jgi:hypothetical protein
VVILAIFDGKVIIPIEPVDLEIDRVYELEFRGVVDDSGHTTGDTETPATDVGTNM